jgi:predicted transcriptional regulator
MTKTTVYLPDELKRAVKRIAAASDRSEAEVIREAIGALARSAERPRPRGGLFDGLGEGLARHVDDALIGFGER